MSEYVTFISGGYSEWCIVVKPPAQPANARRRLRGGPLPEHPTAQLAAHELQAGLAQISGTTLRRVTAISSHAP
ncbi:MAG: hypothetical protein KJ734_03465, partial [Chloroflexi bacterium]|nr:hypothetical protein [Chloroflexota bacterium]